ncbi:hypothetical protein E3O25_10770 [Cryobacterium sp. TMT1-3]|uniref:hypothetical protein n=1 Tax=Cryobacterium sp. TMT1-3 TaxID=1259237 RepID=UPI00106B538B|nr:hypothetical protein [Cryobacterium sp. TMT1-3]TFC26875.1 hypothetical protein E3O25_10770 [Cryobacterium sp. TMT1-3]
MTSTTSTHAAAYRSSRLALAAALQFADNDLTIEAQARRRADMVTAARAQLTAATPAAPASRDRQAEVLASRAPRTADDIAIQNREREKVLALVGAGRSLVGIIDAADESRLAAIVDSIEILPEVLASGDSVGIAAELRGRAFDRLVGLGAADAADAAADDAQDARQAAWSQALTEAQTGEVSMGVRQAIHAVDREGYAASFSDDVPVDQAALRRIEDPAPTMA